MPESYNVGVSFPLRNAHYRVKVHLVSHSKLCTDFMLLQDLRITMHLLAEATTKFTLELYQQLRETKDNIFYSPISIMTTLGMLQLGAKGNTRQQIEKVGVSFVSLTSLNLSLHHAVSVQIDDDKARGLR